MTFGGSWCERVRHIPRTILNSLAMRYSIEIRLDWLNNASNQILGVGCGCLLHAKGGYGKVGIREGGPLSFLFGSWEIPRVAWGLAHGFLTWLIKVLNWEQLVWWITHNYTSRSKARRNLISADIRSKLLIAWAVWPIHQIRIFFYKS